MAQDRDYQHGFSVANPAMYESGQRERKAATMVAVLEDYFDYPLRDLQALDVGASTGIIDAYLARYLGSVTGIDIDTSAIQSAENTFRETNLFFHEGDALDLDISSDAVDVVICSQVYEHVPNAEQMMREIFRVLRPGGVCYFAASNRLMWHEPHYHLPLLSVIPRPLAHRYVRFFGKADRYHELHYTYWGLKRLVAKFEIVDYSLQLIRHTEKYGTSYMLPPGSLKARAALLVARYAYWLSRYVWLLRKPGDFVPQKSVEGDPWQTART